MRRHRAGGLQIVTCARRARNNLGSGEAVPILFAVLLGVANLITNDRVTASIPLRISNGLMSVLLDVLVLAGTDLAQTPWERRLVYWLAQHDQTRSGLGCVGFDVEELGWERDRFVAQQGFVLAVIDGAMARRGWDRLPFVPREEQVIDALGRLRELVVSFTPDLLRPLPESTWVPDELPSHGMCPVHRVVLHELGCIVCNDAPVDCSPEAAPHRSR